MPHRGKLGICIVVCVFLFVARAQTGLKIIDNPGGGKIVYGPVDGAATEPAAMGAILRSLHKQYGDRPQVGRVFHVRGTKSVAVFFTLVKRAQGNAQVGGMLIVSKTGANRVEAALVSDDAARLGSTMNPMLKTLFGVWHPGAEEAEAKAGNGGAAAAVAQLRTMTLQDNSASVGLPEGWKDRKSVV